MRPYEIVEHTADIGIRGCGQTPKELFAHMAQGVFSLIVPPGEVRAAEKRMVQAQADGWDRLLVAWLRELLYLFDTQHFLAKEFSIHRLDPTRIDAEAAGEVLDLERHTVDKEVKAVTYCDLWVQQAPDGGWSAQVILDI